MSTEATNVIEAPKTGRCYRLAIDFGTADQMLGFINDLNRLYTNFAEQHAIAKPVDTLDRVRPDETLHSFKLRGAVKGDAVRLFALRDVKG